MDGIHLNIRRDGKVENTAVYVVLGVDLNGHRDVLGHWVGYGSEGSNFWLTVLSDLQSRGVEDVYIACIDGLTGFRDAIEVFFQKRLFSAALSIRSAIRCVLLPIKIGVPLPVISRPFTALQPGN